MPRGSGAPRRYLSRVAIEAVLFDWGNTLVQFTWDEELVSAGHRAALGRDDDDFTGRWRELVLAEGQQRPYAELLAELGVDDPEAFIDAEHEAWRPAHQVPFDAVVAESQLTRLLRRARRVVLERHGHRMLASTSAGPFPKASTSGSTRPWS